MSQFYGTQDFVVWKIMFELVGYAKRACCRFKKRGSTRPSGRHWAAVKAYVKKHSVLLTTIFVSKMNDVKYIHAEIYTVCEFCFSFCFVSPE